MLPRLLCEQLCSLNPNEVTPHYMLHTVLVRNSTLLSELCIYMEMYVHSTIDTYVSSLENWDDGTCML